MNSKLNNLLIVEDNPFIRKGLKNAANEISSIGEICLSVSIEEAIYFLSKTNFDLMILDLELPDGNGVNLLKWHVANKTKTKVYVFSLSKELKKICLQNGAIAFFDKAKDFDELIETLKNA